MHRSFRCVKQPSRVHILDLFSPQQQSSGPFLGPLLGPNCSQGFSKDMVLVVRASPKEAKTHRVGCYIDKVLD